MQNTGSAKEARSSNWKTVRDLKIADQAAAGT
jgi:hypothetical protein